MGALKIYNNDMMFKCERWVFPAGQAFEWTTGALQRIVYVLAGAGEVKLEKTSGFKANQVFVFPAGVKPFFRFQKNAGLFEVTLDPDDSQFDFFGGPFDDDVGAPVLDILQAVETGLFRGTPSWKRVVPLLLECAFYVLDEQRGRPSNEKEVAVRFKSLLKRQAGNPDFRLDLELETLDFSLDHFRRVFSAEAKKSPNQFLEAEKIRKAGKLLRETDLKIQDVAGILGFNDQYYFSRVFSKLTGVSPRDYRKNSDLEST